MKRILRWFRSDASGAEHPAEHGIVPKSDIVREYMPQQLFDFAAASVAKVHLATGRSTEELAKMLHANYKSAYPADNLSVSLPVAAQSAIQLLSELGAPAPRELLNHFQYFRDNFEPDGSPRQRPLFDGTLFNRAEYDPRRMANFLELLSWYARGAIAGRVPLAPRGWPTQR